MTVQKQNEVIALTRLLAKCGNVESATNTRKFVSRSQNVLFDLTACTVK